MSGVVPEAPTTNQRAEIHAAIRALSALKVPCRVRLFSDSQYLIKTMQGHFRRRTNIDLWEDLDTAAGPHAVEWIWVRGHRGERGNEIAHKLAEREAAKSEQAPYDGLEICAPRFLEDPITGEIDPYYCGRLLLLGDPTDREQACPGGTFICSECTEPFGAFMQKAYDAQAVRQEHKEWDGG